MPQNRRLRLMNVWMHAFTLTMYVWMYACLWCAWCMQGLCICGVIFLSLSTLNRNPYANPYVWSGQSHIAIFLSILCCKILVQQVLQLRLDRRIAMEDWQKYSKGGLPRRLPVNWQASIGVLSSILHCNDSVDPQLQHLFDQSLATEDWQKYCNVALATSDRFAYLSTLLLYSTCCTLHLQPTNQYRQQFAESLMRSLA